MNFLCDLRRPGGSKGLPDIALREPERDDLAFYEVHVRKFAARGTGSHETYFFSSIIR